MRFSKSYIPTTKEAPKDASIPSHIYLARGGFMQQMGAGIYNLLPLGKRVQNKIEAIVRDEMDKSGALEVQPAFVTPAELWRESGRYEKFGKELLRFKDRKNNDFVLGPTHEEAMVSMVKGKVTSYKQLPFNIYQINTKFRDEARPRFGLMRGREFLMKDAYSFHDSQEDLVREFHVMEQTYKNILERLGLEYRVVEADSGAIGGSGSKEFMVLADSGEDTLAVCDSCDYGANIEAASALATQPNSPAPEADSFNKFLTKDMSTIEDIANFFRIDAYYTMKAVVKKAIYAEHEELVVFFLRGSDNLQEVKAVNACAALDMADATEEELLKAGIVPGFIGPIKLAEGIKFFVDNGLKGASNQICGANEKDYHFIGVNVADSYTFKDLREVQEGDKCPCCEGKLKFTKGIEVGHIFQLGTTYSTPLGATYLDNNGKQQPFVMGCYGVGVSRLVAAVIEQSHDEKGCIWTKPTAPYVVNVMISNIKDEAQKEFGESLYKELQANGVDVILDDRAERFGFKIKDAELVGFPYTVIVGKGLAQGSVQILDRKTSQKSDVAVSDVFSKLMELV